MGRPKKNNTPQPSEAAVDVSKLLQESINDYKIESKRKRDDFKSLYNITTEFLNDFIIIGHTIDGNQVSIGHCPTRASRDALIELSRRELAALITAASSPDQDDDEDQRMD